MKTPRPMKIDGDEFASVCLLANGDKPYRAIIDVSMNTLDVRQARALRDWLDKAIEYVKVHNRDRKKAKVTE